MKLSMELLAAIDFRIGEIIDKARDLEETYRKQLARVYPLYQQSAQNMIHYLAFRSFDLNELQGNLRDMGLPSLSHIEAHVMKSLLAVKTIVSHLMGTPEIALQKGSIPIKKSRKAASRNTKALLGPKPGRRRTRIMVTMPSLAAGDSKLVNKLIAEGMNVARINCAHDDPETWKKIIEQVKHAGESRKKNCSIAMDLAGPKLRTGAMAAGPEVIHLKPQRDTMGNVIKPSKVWLAPPDILPPDDNADAILPIRELFIKKVKRGDTISFADTRGKKCKVQVIRKQGLGRWGLCYDSAYLTTGTTLTLHRLIVTDEEIAPVDSLLPIEQSITLHTDDTLILHRDLLPGEPAKYDTDGNLLSPAHISCTLPEVFKFVRTRQPVYFDDGRIEGIIEETSHEHILVKITNARDTGSKLRADKGINLLESEMEINGLNEKDRQDLEFVVHNADIVNVSFVNQAGDVEELFAELDRYNASPGVVLKIETRSGFRNLPSILLTAMQRYPVGVMIARGDLAIETGWKNFAGIQEEILRICESAHIPDIWATQVLESMAKKGIPTRAEITDAAMAQRAECVMLNKGIYITNATRMLDRILRRMQHFHKRKETLLPRLKDAGKLALWHDEFDAF